MRPIHLVALAALASTVPSIIVACGSDEDDASKAETADDDASANASDARRDDATIESDAAITTDAANEGSVTNDACAIADAGVGATCATDVDCACNLVCAALKCVPRSACDEGLLTWDGPTQYADGRCVTTLAGFNIYGARDGGTDASDAGIASFAIDAGYPCVLGAAVACGDAGGTTPRVLCAYRVKDLTDGTWTFSVTAYDDAGVESAPSLSASKNVACP